MSPLSQERGGGYRASLIKRRRPRTPPPVAPPDSSAAPQPPARDLERELRRDKRMRIQVEREAIARVQAMTETWNDELSSTVPSLAAVVSRAVAAIVGEAPREDVVLAALGREVARVRGDHRPVLRVAQSDRREWIDALSERGRNGDTPFDVRRDDMLTPGKCILELGARRVDLTPETQVAAFDDFVRGGIADVDAPVPPALPSVALDPVEDNDAEETGRGVAIDRTLAVRARAARKNSASRDGSSTAPSERAGAQRAQPTGRRTVALEGGAKAVISRAPTIAVARGDQPDVERPETPVATKPAPQLEPQLGPKPEAKGAADPAPLSNASETSVRADADTLDGFDSLDLGANAARFEAEAPNEGDVSNEADGGKAPRSAVRHASETGAASDDAPGLADAPGRAPAEPGPPRNEAPNTKPSTVSRLRERVSRDVSGLRAMVSEAEAQVTSEAEDPEDHERSGSASSRWASVARPASRSAAIRRAIGTLGDDEVQPTDASPEPERNGAEPASRGTRSTAIRSILAEIARPGDAARGNEAETHEAERKIDALPALADDAPSTASAEPVPDGRAEPLVGTDPATESEPETVDDKASLGSSARERRRRTLNLPDWMTTLDQEQRP